MFIVTMYSFPSKQGYCMSSIKTQNDTINEFEVEVYVTSSLDNAIEYCSTLSSIPFEQHDRFAELEQTIAEDALDNSFSE